MITREKLLNAGFESGTDMGDGRVEYYYQKIDTDCRIEKEFYLWHIDGKYIIELLWEGYESNIKIELKDWKELEMLFFAFIREKLIINPLKIFHNE